LLAAAPLAAPRRAEERVEVANAAGVATLALLEAAALRVGGIVNSKEAVINSSSSNNETMMMAVAAADE
jgi:hypothetical protein